MSSENQSPCPDDRALETGLADDSSSGTPGDSGGTGPLSGDQRRNQILAWIALLVFASLLLGMRIRYYDWPPDHDVTLYAVIGHELLQGRELYTDLFDHKPPALYISFALSELLFGYGPSQIFWGNLVCGLLILIGVYRVAINAGMGRAAGLWSAAFWALLSSELQMQVVDLNTESFINVLMVWIFALWPGNSKETMPWRRVAAVSVLIALMSLYKHNTVVIAGALAIVHIIMPPLSCSRVRAVAQVGIFLATGVVVWAAMFAYFAILGRFDDAYFTLITFNSAHAGNLGDNLLRAISPSGLARDLSEFRVLIPLMGLTLMGMIVGLWKGPRRQWVMLAALMAGGHVALFLPGNEFNHYYQLWVPGLVIGAGWSIMQMKHTLQQRHLVIRWSPVALGAVAAALICIYVGLLLPRDFKRLYSGSGEMGWYEAQKLAREIRYWLVDEETLYQWGNEPYFYFYTRKSNPTIIWSQHATTSKFKDRFTKRILKDLKSNPPDLVVVHALFAVESPDHEVLKWIKANYYAPLGGRLDKEYRYYLIHIRKGSDLARRVRSGAIRQ